MQPLTSPTGCKRQPHTEFAVLEIRRAEGLVLVPRRLRADARRLRQGVLAIQRGVRVPAVGARWPGRGGERSSSAAPGRNARGRAGWERFAACRGRRGWRSRIARPPRSPPCSRTSASGSGVSAPPRPVGISPPGRCIPVLCIRAVVCSGSRYSWLTFTLHAGQIPRRVPMVSGYVRSKVSFQRWGNYRS